MYQKSQSDVSVTMAVVCKYANHPEGKVISIFSGEQVRKSVFTKSLRNCMSRVDKLLTFVVLVID